MGMLWWYGGIIHNSPKVQATEVFLDWWMDKGNIFPQTIYEYDLAKKGTKYW
jgi:hypothetical protein